MKNLINKFGDVAITVICMVATFASGYGLFENLNHVDRLRFELVFQPSGAHGAGAEALAFGQLLTACLLVATIVFGIVTTMLIRHLSRPTQQELERIYYRYN